MRWQSTTVRLGSIRLADGRHTIRVPYFQGPRDTVALTLEVAGPGEQPRIFSTDEFKPPPDPETRRFPPEPEARRPAGSATRRARADRGGRERQVVAAAEVGTRGYNNRIRAVLLRNWATQLGNHKERLCVIRIISKKTGRSTRLAGW